MIIKFQIYSILHTIPSKGILESHTNVLLNRTGVLNFILQFFLVLVREVPSTYLGNASVSPALPPTEADVLQLKFSEVFRWKDRVSISPNMLFSFSPTVLIFQNLHTRVSLCLSCLVSG